MVREPAVYPAAGPEEDEFEDDPGCPDCHWGVSLEVQYEGEKEEHGNTGIGGKGSRQAKIEISGELS